MTETTPPEPFPGLSWQDITNVVAMCATAQWDPLNHPEWKATLDRLEAISKAGPDGQQQAEAPAEPPLPGVLEIRTDGRLVAEVFPGADGRVVCNLPAAAEPELAALPAGAPDGWYGEDDDEPADAFAGRVDPEAAF